MVKKIDKLNIIIKPQKNLEKNYILLSLYYV